MNVFCLDKNMETSAEMLDDSHLNAQINEACQILMANYNKEFHPNARIGHVNHPVTKFYADREAAIELLSYLLVLCREYAIRKGKEHQNVFWALGFKEVVPYHRLAQETKEFVCSKTYVNGTMTNDICEIRKYISTKQYTKPLIWTYRDKPEWWLK